MGGDTSFDRQPTLCWDCAKAVKECDWSREFKPVEGWTAILRELLVNGQRIVSYVVIKCPEFKRDATKGGTVRWKPGDPIIIPRVLPRRKRDDET